MSDNVWHSHNGGGSYINQSPFANRNTFGNNQNPFGNNNTYGNNQNPFASKDVFGSKNVWKKDDPYRSDNVYGKDETLQPKYKRFSDLKILNENMMHMSNNTLPEESRIEILSQGEKGEIKNILSGRILRISLIPALSSLALSALVIFTDSALLTAFGLLVYIAILVRTFFFPAKLYYENVAYKTTKPARAFFEEMDYWWKISVVNIYVYLVIVSIAMFIFSFYEDDIVRYLMKVLNTNVSIGNINDTSLQKKFIEGISFSISLKLLSVFNIVVLAYYSHFTNKEKEKEEEVLKERMRLIRNESMSRVQQVQQDKNDF